MKLIGTYTARGQIDTDKSFNRVNIFDGDYTTGYRLTRISIAPENIDYGTNVRAFACKVVTANQTPTDANSWDWENNQEIAWAFFNHDANFISPTIFNEVDRTNLLIEDCYITAFETNTGADTKLNYLLEFEKYELAPMRGSLAIVQNRSQG